MNIKLTVFFEEEHWVGKFERTNDGKLETAKVVFDTEPNDDELYNLVLTKFNKLHYI